MRKRTALLLALLLVVLVISHAQDAATPWPPDPNTLFAPGVEMMAVQEVEQSLPLNLEHSFEPYADNQRRIVYIYDEAAKGWNEYPYPKEAADFGYYHLKKRSDGLFSFYSTALDSYSIWLFNAQTGEFLLPESICGTIRNAPGEGWWVVVPQEPGASEYRLCFTETGEMTEPLPAVEKGSGQQWQSIGTSPDQDWVVLLDKPSCASNYYGYQVSTGTLNHIGAFDSPLDQCHIEFQDDTFFLLFIDSMPEWSPRGIYAGDVTKSNSLDGLLDGFRFWPTHYDNPSRYELIPGMSGEGIGWRGWSGNGPLCVLQIYYLDTRQLKEYDLSELCTPNLIQPDDYTIRYFRYVSLDLTQPAVVARYDLRTQQRTNFFEGEIEAIADVSPDGRYLLLLMDDNGKIDVRPDVLDPVYWTPFGHTYWAVFDTETQKLVYRLDDELIADDLAISTNWFGNDAFAFSQMHAGSGYDYIRWVWLDTGETLFTDEVNAQQTSPDGQKIVLTLDKPLSSEVGGCQIKVIDLSARKLIPITQKSNDYCCNALPIIARWQDNDTLILAVKQDYQAETAMQYTVRLPD